MLSILYSNFGVWETCEFWGQGMPGRSVMKKYFAAFIVTFLVAIFFFGFIPHHSEKNKTIRYAIHFLPSFDRDLLVEFACDTGGTGLLTLSQHEGFVLTNVINYNKSDNLLMFIKDASDFSLSCLTKTVFRIENHLGKVESVPYMSLFQTLYQNRITSKHQDFLGTFDGMSIMLVHEQNGIADTSWFGIPDYNSKSKAVISEIISLLQNNENSIVEKTVDNFWKYISYAETNSKVLNTDPLCVRIFSNDEYNKNFIEKLPECDTLFLDLTHYRIPCGEQVDVSEIAQAFTKKYKKIRWILNPENMDNFKGLSPNPSYPW